MYIYRLCHALGKAGHEVDVVHCVDSYHLAHPAEPEVSFADHPRVTVHRLRSPFRWLSPLLTQQTGRAFLKRRAIRRIMASKAYDVIHACFSYADGPQVHMHAGWSAVQVPFTSGFEAWFDEALIKYDQGKLRVLVGPDAEQPEVPDFSGVDGYRNEIAYFLSCVETKSQPARCTPASSRDSMLLISAELASMDSGDVVVL